MKMIVWVATHYWDNEVNEGSEVLGVFKNHDRAYKEIENAAEIERKTESDDFWDCDCTWAEGDEFTSVIRRRISQTAMLSIFSKSHCTMSTRRFEYGKKLETWRRSCNQ